MNIINSNDHTSDLGITMSGDCSFNEHINLRTKQCRQLTGWILHTFKSRDKCTMDYGGIILITSATEIGVWAAVWLSIMVPNFSKSNQYH